MVDNLKTIQKQVDGKTVEAATARQQADAERTKASIYDTDARLGDKNFHEQQATNFDLKAQQLEAEAEALKPKLAETQSRITELKTQRETINRETLNQTVAIDRELDQLQGGLHL
jgi:predicted RNase H-like nuclease (RuvC/YqgF family)